MTATQGESAARIATLDLIRGVAVMGIVVMNIVSFAMPEPAYVNPHAYGVPRLSDDIAWVVAFVLVDGKMRGLFSFLFGASMLLVADRAEAAGRNPARVHHIRMAWLWAFGMAHLLLLWSGDILQHYALVGVAAFAFRDARPRQLVLVAAGLIALECWLLAGLPGAIAAADHAAAAHPSVAAIAAREDYARSFGRPAADWIAADVAAHRGGYLAALRHRLPDVVTVPVDTLLYVGAETLAYMLLGMAALKSGMLAGGWPLARYRCWAATGMAIGLVGYGAMAAYAWASGFAMEAVALTGLSLAVPLRPVMIVGWACLVVVLGYRHGPIARCIAAAGRMAFTNYLATSVICAALFDGLGLYGRLTRLQLDGVALAICLAMLSWSSPWLARFRFGPLEWLWRSLARGGWQPMRGAAR